jgi:3-isopropylmalate/(R)-2-methylmalate dehydratase small subunit
VWAIYDYGFRAVVSSFFADIFKNNCLNIGVLPVTVSNDFLKKIFIEIDKNTEAEMEINLLNQSITLISTGESETFDINSYKKENMQNGFDDIDYLLNMKAEILSYSAKQ